MQKIARSCLFPAVGNYLITRHQSFVIPVIVAISLHSLTLLGAITSINAVNKNAYGANAGWMDFRGNTNAGAIIGEFVCSGYLYGANIGWIHLGSNAPANGIHYRNNSATDYGVNHDGVGNLVAKFIRVSRQHDFTHTDHDGTFDNCV